MTAVTHRLQVAILAVPESSASTVYGMYDLLMAAGVDWELVMSGTPGQPLITPRIVTAEGAAIPDLMVAPQASIAGHYPVETEWLRRVYRHGAILSSACSGALLLAEAGLLDDQDATTHWAYCESMSAVIHVCACIRSGRWWWPAKVNA